MHRPDPSRCPCVQHSAVGTSDTLQGYILIYSQVRCHCRAKQTCLTKGTGEDSDCSSRTWISHCEDGQHHKEQHFKQFFLLGSRRLCNTVARSRAWTSATSMTQSDPQELDTGDRGYWRTQIDRLATSARNFRTAPVGRPTRTRPALGTAETPGSKAWQGQSS